MKKVVLPLLLVCLTSASLRAQEAQETTATGDNGYNKWSIEVAGGVNKPFRTFTPGFRTDRANLFTVDLGTRYMFNNKFGLKLDFGYNKFENNDESPKFESTYLRADIQAVINLGRVLSFEDWTSSIGLLAHGGGGVYQLSSDKGFDGEDYGANLIGGLTAQLKLSRSIVLTGDVTGIANGFQNRSFDGFTANNGKGVVVNGTLGLTFYLGKHEQHADWATNEKKDELAAIEDRLGSIETMMNDTDKDGVPDYLDAEPNSTTGVAVDTKGRAIDLNNNGIPDELEKYVDAKNKEVIEKVGKGSGSGTDLEGLINGGYVNVYFDFNKDVPNAQSVGGINFLMKYLKENPSASADVIGYADEIGNTDYNKDLSKRRAENVKKILVDSGIAASRLNIIGNGEDTSVSKSSKEARQVVRRVTFIIK
ncbi:OmpA family protein [Flavobacterium cerinum]|uniref:OmpA family protein n=1 Tax=Flavobacterium cerinum TaxID=2502784 RepID=A0A3S3Q9Y2_9FLAO|nr:OmpA family protein [Flavobacterium cerinum]RWW96660.1 OmpA family protein [Flavobacterium cerinum]